MDIYIRLGLELGIRLEDRDKVKGLELRLGIRLGARIRLVLGRGRGRHHYP